MLLEMQGLIYAVILGVAILGVILLFFMEAYPTPRRYWLIQKIPGPKGVFLLGNAVELAYVKTDDVFQWLETTIQKFKRMTRVWVVGTCHVYLREPRDIQILLNSKQHITKGYEYVPISQWLDEGLLTSTGDKWHTRRKILTPTFHFKILEDNMINFNTNAKVLTQKLLDSGGKEADVESYTTLCTLDIIGETAMGISIDAQNQSTQKYVREVKRITKTIIHRLLRIWLYKDVVYYLTKTGIQFYKTRKFLHDFSYKVINERKLIFSQTDVTENSNTEGVKVRRAFLDRLLDIEAKDPGCLTDKDMREEVDTFMFEGHDTTSTALNFLFFNLATYADVQEKLYQEMRDIFGESDRDVTSSDLHRMVYLEKVIKESLRLYPSVPYLSRLLDKDLILEDGVIIPSNTNVGVFTYLLHRNAEYWTDPETFDPERFSEDQIQGRHPYAYLPFSAGQRNCIGQKFAMMELKTVVATVVRKIKLLPITKREDFRLTLPLILKPNKKLMCKFISRDV